MTASSMWIPSLCIQTTKKDDLFMNPELHYTNVLDEDSESSLSKRINCFFYHVPENFLLRKCHVGHITLILI